MDNLNVIDRFMEAFIHAIDSGLGLLHGDVAFLTTILIGIDITLAGLFWAMEEGNVLGRLLRKVLYVGAFALILDNFAGLADIVFRSFAGLGLHVSGNGLTASDLLRPGKLAGIGFEAAWPLLRQAGSLMGFTSFFNHAVTIIVLLLAWAVVIAAFFILAVQLFITILEFKLTTLAGFVLVPFALWNRTAFLAERVLGNVIASGIKVMMLAVIVGLGSGFFGGFVTALRGHEPSLADAMSLVLASIALFGLGIFGPGIAAGLVSGAPQLGAGAAVGTAGAVAAGALVAGGAASAGARAMGSGGLAALRAGTGLGAAASTAYGLGQATAGAEGLAGIGAGLAGVARAGAGMAGERLRSSAVGGGLADSVEAGRQAAWRVTSGALPSSSAGSAPGGAPDWARRLRAEQRLRAHAHTTLQAIKEGDRPGAGAHPSLDEGRH
jgi:type IV secretion system protein TrbL